MSQSPPRILGQGQTLDHSEEVLRGRLNPHPKYWGRVTIDEGARQVEVTVSQSPPQGMGQGHDDELKITFDTDASQSPPQGLGQGL